MKSLHFALLFCSFALLKDMQAQRTMEHPFLLVDTLLNQDFESVESDVPLGFPAGNDTVWVNYDADDSPQACFEDITTMGWYPYPDESEPNSTNFTYTSCSYTDPSPTNGNCQTVNRNWLIAPPITILQENATLHWRSLSLFGPYWMDGYKVLVSTTTNLPDAFTDTLFKAAETIDAIQPQLFGSLNPADYTFTAGYIQADTYTNPEFFFEDIDAAGYPFLHGKLEPHQVNLGQYMGQQIYIAFLHDSDCDFIIQLDDILVLDGTSAVEELANIHDFRIMGNPVSDALRFSFTAAGDMQLQATLTDMTGTPHLMEQISVAFGSNRYTMQVDHLPSGVYQLSLSNGKGISTRKVVKIN